jgi:hypothetical protein
MSSPAVAINFNGPAQKKSKGRVENIPRTKDQAARTHDLAPRAQDTGAARCHGTQCSGVTVDKDPRYCAHIERGEPPFGPPYLGRAAYIVNYHARPEQKKNRASRNAARATMAKAGKVKKGDGKDVAHRNGNPRDNSSKNLSVQPKSKNRSFPRKKA